MSKDSNSPLYEFTRFSTATLFAGIVAAVYMMQKPLLTGLFGSAGILSFILSIKHDDGAERAERLLSVLGLTLSVISLIYISVRMIQGLISST